MKIYSILISIFLFSVLINPNAQEGWEINVDSYNNYIPACVANGRIGIIPEAEPFQTKDVILNHVFDKTDTYGISKVLIGSNPFNISIVIDNDTITLENCKSWHQSLNLKKAILTTELTYKNKAKITYQICALRNLQYCGLMNFKITPEKNISVKVINQIKTPQDFKDVHSDYRMLRDLEARMPVFRTTASSPFGKQQLSTASGFIFGDSIPILKEDTSDPYNSSLSFSKNLNKGQSYDFSLIGSVCSSRDFNDPFSESDRFVVYGQRLGKDKVLNQHTKLWSELWQSDIQIEGDSEAQIDVRFALYNLYSYIRKDSNLSISPMGLSTQGYNGHIFWDSEIWMFPPLLALHPELAKSMLNYRIDRLDKAVKKAQNFGFKGAMFPWESDDSGEEATPTWCLTGTEEIHITADVGIALWNYYCTTQDTTWLKEKAWPVLKEIASFWCDRATENKDGSFSITNVVGANEFAHGVTDNAFTNGSGIEVLNHAISAAKIIGIKAPEQWNHIASNLRIAKFDNGITRENETYNGETIKQADVNLLAYPLHIVSDKEAIQKDLEYYAPRFDKNGPAMTYSIQSILYSKLGNADMAYKMFRKSYIPNKRAPFGVLTESAYSNNPYFATGAGGMLQAVLFGFAGLEITNEGLTQGTPCLPKHWKSIKITGLSKDKETITVR